MDIPRPFEQDACVRDEVYKRIDLPESAIQRLEQMIADAPARKGDGGALRNKITLRYTHKSSRPILSESHTCEAIYHNVCDIDPDVVAFYSQVALRGVKRPKGLGYHVSNATLDVLVFNSDSIKIVECKHLETLNDLITQEHPDWQKEDGRFIHVPYRNWATSHGLLYETYSPPFPFCRYQVNVEALRALLFDPLSENDHAIIAELVWLCRMRGPLPAATLCAQVSGAKRRHVMRAMLDQMLVGTLLSDLLDSPRFLVGLPGCGIEEKDRLRLESIADLSKDPIVHDEFLLHSQKHRDIAIQRRDRILAMRAGKDPWTRRYKEMSNWLESIDATPAEMLKHLLPNYQACGNDKERLFPEQINLLNAYAKRWEKGRYSKPQQALTSYHAVTERLNIPPVSSTTFRKKLKSVDPEKRAMASEGFRGYQHVKARSSPLNRSHASLLPGHTAYVDSTALDVRSGPLVEFDIPAERAWIYVAREPGGLPLARSFVLGNARTDGLAILWRVYVFRNGELPRLVHIDRGSENRSDWHKDFAKGMYDLRIQETSGSRSNQPAEDLNNHINSCVSHWLPGNTLLDKKGRAADGKFKSVKTARIGLKVICGFIDEFLFKELAWRRLVNGTTAGERYKERVELFGISGGKPCTYDDEFLIKTSLPVKRYDYSEKDGIRTTDGYYLNDEMQVLLRQQRPERVLEDCVDPSLMYVQVKERWFRALRSDTWDMQDLSYDERLAYLMTERMSVAINRSEREAADKDRYLAMRAESQRDINESLAPHPTQTNVLGPHIPEQDESAWKDDSLDDSEPYDEAVP